MLKRSFISLLFLFMLASPSFAAEPFLIENIQVEGLQRVQPGAILIVLPVKQGDEWNDSLSDRTIQLLYGTDLFDSVEILRDGNDLVIRVTERPTLVEVTFAGNKKIKDAQIESILNAAQVVSGGIYSPNKTDEIIDLIKEQYGRVGYFATDIELSVEPLERNRLNLNFDIFEGDAALIKEILIIGNEDVPTEDILDVMKLSTKKTLGILNRNNRYNRQVLIADLEKITSHYYDLGYIDFEVVSSRAFITEERDGLLITITVSEGEQYTLADVSVESTSDVVSQERLDSLIEGTPGDLYTFSATNETRTNLTEEFTNQGYARTEVDSIPTINDEDRTVSVKFVVNPGQLTYVRKITFVGNVVTADEVLRREMRLLEGAEYSEEKILQSRSRIGRLGLFNNVDIDVQPVPGVSDQVDILVTVSETLTGSVLFGVGYSDSEKAQLSFNVSQKNLFGTGKELALKTRIGKVTKHIDVRYTNPYYTLDGISRGFSVKYTEDDTAESDDTSVYNLGLTGFGVHYVLPVSEEGSIGLDFGAEQYSLSAPPTLQQDYQINQFISENPDSNAALVGVRYTLDTRDRAIFPTSGHQWTLAGEFSVGDYSYYVLRNHYSRFMSLGESMTLKLTGNFDYANEALPFFRNFYMVGSSTIRGFDSARLGPKELCRLKLLDNDEYSYGICPTNRVVGGNVRILGRAELYLPLFGTEDSDDKRVSTFIDAGNTFRVKDDENTFLGEFVGAYEPMKADNLRVSSGIAFEWLSPIGPFSISYALPVQKKDGDDLDRFQVTLGYFN